MRVALAGLILLVWAGCAVPLPADRWEVLNEAHRALRKREAATYLPERFAEFETRLRATAARLQRQVSVEQGLGVAELSGQVDDLLAEAAALEAALERTRSELQRRQDEAIALFRARLEQADGYRQVAELQPLVSRLEEKLAAFRPFSEPGAAAANSALVEQTDALFEQLQQRWVRYSGSEGPSPELDARLETYHQAVAALRPAGAFIVIDTALNRLSVRQGEAVLLDAVCSIGSGHQMVAEGRHWEFTTPRGEFTIRRRIREPSWRKPDWAFLEEGQPVPNSEQERIEKDVLGAFAFEFADGYFIHGTLYKRLLGQPVTHGCIRLEDEDLLQVASLVGKGSRVYIF